MRPIRCWLGHRFAVKKILNYAESGWPAKCDQECTRCGASYQISFIDSGYGVKSRVFLGYNPNFDEPPPMPKIDPLVVELEKLYKLSDERPEKPPKESGTE